MAANTNVQAPTLDEENYSKWRRDIEIWSLCSNLVKTKLGPACYLTLPPLVRDCVRNITIADLNKENGLELI